MTIAAPVLTSARDLVQARLRTALSRLDPQLAAIAGYHFGWLDADGRPLAADGGKLLRASLVLLSAAACGADPGRGLPGATAVELAHNFSLLHDDVMDGDEQRRHRPTAWTVFGASAAIVAGDALLALAQEELCDNPPAARHLAIAVQRLCSGQLADLRLERRSSATVAECMTMAAGKTGALLASACAIGAMLAEAPASVVTALERFGEHLGLAFQVADDILGIWGDPAVTGKPVMSDLRTRKKSIPVAAALCVSDTFAALYSQPEPLTDHELDLARALIEEAGGRSWAQAELTRQIDAAAQHLDVLGPNSAQRAELLAIADFVTTRDH